MVEGERVESGILIGPRATASITAALIFRGVITNVRKTAGNLRDRVRTRSHVTPIPLRNASVNREKYDRPPGRWVRLRLLDRCYSCPGASVMNFKILLLRSSYVARNNFLVGMEDRLVDL